LEGRIRSQPQIVIQNLENEILIKKGRRIASLRMNQQKNRSRKEARKGAICSSEISSGRLKESKGSHEENRKKVIVVVGVTARQWTTVISSFPLAEVREASRCTPRASHE
jgi:uncharacterized Zn finger protein